MVRLLFPGSVVWILSFQCFVDQFRDFISTEFTKIVFLFLLVESILSHSYKTFCKTIYSPLQGLLSIALTSDLFL